MGETELKAVSAQQSGGLGAPPAEDHSAEARLRETVREGAKEYEAS
jgi:hypothetical protein